MKPDSLSVLTLITNLQSNLAFCKIPLLAAASQLVFAGWNYFLLFSGIKIIKNSPGKIQWLRVFAANESLVLARMLLIVLGGSKQSFYILQK